MKIFSMLLMLTLIMSNSTWAQDQLSCRVSDLPEDRKNKAQLLAAESAKLLNKIEKQYAEEGRDFKVAIIGRIGSDTSSGQIIDNTIPLNELYEEYRQQRLFRRRARSWPIWLSRQATGEQFVYSHIGFVVKNHRRVKWGLYHLLVDCGEVRAEIENSHDLMSFFYDFPHRYGAEILIPSQSVQDQLEEILLRKAPFWGQLISDEYNAAALPWPLNPNFKPSQQNSNSWPLEVLAAAINPELIPKQLPEKYSREYMYDLRTKIQLYLKDTGYRASRIYARGLISSMAPIAAILPGPFEYPNIDFSRQPLAGQNVFDLITPLSIRKYLSAMGHLERKYNYDLASSEISEE